MLISYHSFAQQTISSDTTAIRLAPHLGQGYLVLRKSVQPNIHYWKVTILERTYATTTDYTEQVAEIHTLPEKQNYIKIPLQYRASKGSVRYFAQIEGYSKTNVKLWEEPIKAIAVDAPPIDFACQGCTPYFQACSWICNGTNYAWKIQQYKHPDTDISHFILGQAYDYFDDINQITIPYYYYLPISAISSFPYDPTNINITSPFNTNTSSGLFCSPNNTPLSGVVFGVAKDLGPWKDGYVSTSGGQPLLLGLNACFDYRISMINLMNSYADFTNSVGNSSLPNPLDPLSCHPSFCDVDINVGSTGGQDLTDIEHCRLLNLQFDVCNEGEVAPDDCDGGYIAMMDALFDCDVDLLPTKPGIAHVTITDLNGEWGINTTGSIRINFNEEKGEWEAPNLPKSLYSIGVLFNDGQYLPLVKEFSFTNQKPKERERANFLEAKVIPVPIVDNYFEMRLKAEERLRFHYELFDTYGNKLHERDFVMQKNEEMTTLINPNTTIPTGLVMHRFIFMDGSFKTVETIKN